MPLAFVPRPSCPCPVAGACNEEAWIIDNIMTRRIAGEDTTMSTDGNNKPDLATAEAALLEAVEAPLAPTGTDETDHSVVPIPFLSLFVSGSSRHQLREGLTVRDQRRVLFQVIETFSKPTARRFFAALYQHVDAVIQSESYLPDSAYPEGERSEEDGSLVQVTPDPESSKALEFLNFAAQSVKAYVEGLVAKKDHRGNATRQTSLGHIKLNAIDEVFQVARSLHDVLIWLNSAGPDAVEAQASIVQLCELWWASNGESREFLVLQTLPILVQSIIVEDTRAAILRLYQLREAIQSVDFRSSDSHEFKSKLLHLASSPKVLKLPEGRRLLSFLMGADVLLLRGLHKAIRAQIPVLRGSLLTAFGECYLRAWMDAPNQQVRDDIESVAIQDLAHAAVHAARPNLFKCLLTVLEPLHGERKNPEVEKLLFRMYSGMLWRALSTPNGKIRVNATHVFAQVFPLRDASSSQTENAIRKAVDSLETLLQDPDPSVRAAASHAVAQILPTYWDVLPPQEIRELLTFIVMEHASDRTSSVVRVAAVDTITRILDSPHSHGVIRPLLPVVGNLIHDRVEKVRLAVVRMLLRVKSIKGIKYYHVVPVDHLTGRLAAEASINSNGPVAVALTGLMMNSFCPQGPSARPKDQVHRMIKLVTEHPIAASAFYSNISRHVPSAVIENLVANVFRCVHFAVREARREIGAATTDGRKRSREHDEDTVTVSDASEATESPAVKATDFVLLTGLIETASTLCHSMGRKSKRSASATNGRTRLETLDGQVFLDLLSFFEDAMDSDEDDYDDRDSLRVRAVAALLACAEYLPSGSAQDAVLHAKKVLSSISDETPSLSVSPYVSLLCSLGLTDDVASSLAASIESSFDGDFTLNFASPEAGTRKRKTKKSGGKRKSLVVPMMPPRIALNVLSDIMNAADTGFELARHSLFSSAVASDVVEGSLARGIKFAERVLQGGEFKGVVVSEVEVEYILDVCEAYGRFTVHKEAISKRHCEKTGDHVKKLIEWTSTTALPLLASGIAGIDHVPFNDPDLSRISIEKSFDDRVSSPMPTGPPRQRPNRNRTPLRLDMNESLLGCLTTPQSSARGSRRTASDFAMSLLQSCVVLLSEGLRIGSANISMVGEMAIKWMDVFQTEEEILHLESLLPGLSLLAYSLCKHASEFELLKHLLVKCPESDDQHSPSPVASIVSKLMATRSLTVGTVNCVLHAVQLLLHGEEMASPELPGSMDELFTDGRGCARSAVKAICSSKAGYHEFSKRLVGAFDTQELEEVYQMFCAQCLYVLCDASSSKFAPETRSMVRRLDVEATGVPQGVKTVLDALIAFDADSATQAQPPT